MNNIEKVGYAFVVCDLLHIGHLKLFRARNEKWESPFTFKIIKKGENQKLEFLLYKNQVTEAYRSLHLWISVT